MVLKFLCWNINGLNQKLDDPMFNDLLDKFDFTFLVETWLNKTISVDDHYCYSKNRIKSKINGRHSGGITLITKQHLRDGIKILENDSNIFLCVKLDKLFFSLMEDLYVFVIYLPPDNSSFYNYTQNENPFEKISSTILQYSKKGQIFLMGDFNARTQGLIDYFENKETNFLYNETDIDLHNQELSPRKNMDHSKNKFGKFFVDMCKELQLVIHNGRTIGDLQGQYTCYKNNGCSTVDYSVSCNKLAKHVLSFSVLDPNHLSDHAPIATCIENNCRINNTKPNKCRFESIKNKFIWEQNSKENLDKVFQNPVIQKKINDFYNFDISDYNKCKENVDLLCSSLTHIYHDAAKLSLKIKTFSKKKRNKNRKKWHDVSYDVLIKNINLIGKKIKQIPNDPALLKQYAQLKKQANKQKKDNNKKFRQQLLDKIINLDRNNPTEFWKLVNKLKHDKTEHLSNPGEYAKYISNLFNLKSNHVNEKLDLSKKLECLFNNDTYVDKLDKKIEPSEVLDCLKKLKNGKSSGHDLVINEILKHSSNVMAPLIVKLFNLILQHEYFPEYWSLGFITPIFKGGDPCVMSNYRPITVTSNLSKLFTFVMNSRLNDFISTNNLLNNEQIGFRKGQSTNDHLFVLKTLIDSFKSQKKTLFTCFIDLSKAFDSVWREALYYKLFQLGISSKFVKIIRSLYSNVQSKIKIHNLLSDTINIDVGTRQGCNLSPALFNIFLNDLPTVLHKNNCDPVLLYDVYINILMYADDVVLISSSKHGLQKCLNIFGNFCYKWNLHINVNKTKVVLFNSRKQDNFFLNSKLLSQAESYCYLGIVLQRNGTFKTGIENLTLKGKRAYHSWASDFSVYNKTPIDVIMKLFDTLVKPILLYGSEIWGAFSKSLMHENYKKYLLNCNSKFEIFFTSICKSILGVRKTASNLGVKAELGVFPLSLLIMQKLIHYYVRLSEMDNTALVKKALLHQNVMYLNECQNDMLVKRSYLHSVFSVMKFTNCTELNLDKFGKISKPSKIHLKNNLQDRYSKLFFNSFTDRYSDKKLRTYMLVKKNYKKENYLNFIKSFAIRRAVTKFRLSDHSLPIELGRRNNSPLCARICDKCAMNRVGDEFHFIMKCNNPNISNLREEMFKNINYRIPNFSSLCEENQFLYILLSHDVSVTEYSSKFIYYALKSTNQF